MIQSFSNARKTTGLNPTPSRTLTEEDIGSDPRETENATLLQQVIGQGFVGLGITIQLHKSVPVVARSDCFLYCTGFLTTFALPAQLKWNTFLSGVCKNNGLCVQANG